MKSRVLKSDPQRFMFSGATLAIFGIAALFTTLSQAQVYRIVGPDGKVTFSDKPPAQGATPASGTSPASGKSGSSTAALPFELRQVASKYPVTLYVGDNCGPCGGGRSMLTSRGIPFVEKTVNTNEDIQALQRMGGEASLPFLTIGSQQLRGFSDSEWSQFLDAAGYPASSVLPSSYRRAPATPLVAVAPAATPATVGAAVRPPPAARAEPAAAAPSTNNPSNIRF